jgi:hypothetical protein
VYVELLKSILSGGSPGYGRNGYYLAASGSVAWIDIYTAMAKALAKRQVIKSSEVKEADEAAVEEIGKALECPKELVAVQIVGMQVKLPNTTLCSKAYKLQVYLGIIPSR